MDLEAVVTSAVGAGLALWLFVEEVAHRLSRWRAAARRPRPQPEEPEARHASERPAA